MKSIVSNTYLLIAFSKRDIAKIKQFFSDASDILWLYLGKNFIEKRSIEQELGDCFRYIDIAKFQDDIANDIRQEYILWVDDLNRCYGSKLEWWFGIISSRNVYSSNLFQYACYLEVLERLWDTKKDFPKLVFVESYSLANAIKRWAFKKSISIDIVGYGKAKQQNLANYFLSFFQQGKFIVILLLRWFAAYISRKQCAFQSQNLKGISPIILDTYIHNSCLSKEGIFTDRYYPHLHEFLSKKKETVLVHPVFYGFRYNYLSIYKRMRKSKTLFILQEDFLRLSDYLSILVYPLKIMAQKIKASAFHGFSLSDILKEEHRKQIFEINALEALLIYRLFLRLGKIGIRPKAVINWYENQAIDRALIIGSKHAFPRAKVIGAQLFIHYPNFLNLFPLESEVETEVVPDIIFGTSQQQCQITQSFAKNITCKPVAALRYAHVFNSAGIFDNDSCFYCDKKTILVLLSFDIYESIEILDMLKIVLEQIDEDIQILVKNHPDYNVNDILKAFGKEKWPDRFKIFRGSLSDALKQTRVVISSTSSSIVEAAAKGLPVIFLGRQTVLNQNPLADLNMDIATECFSASDLVESINKYINLSAEEIIRYREMGIKVRDMYFTPINDETMLPFVDIESSI